MPDVRVTDAQYTSIRATLGRGTTSQKRIAAAMGAGAGWPRVDVTKAPTAAPWPAYVPPQQAPKPPAPAAYGDTTTFQDGGSYG